jgi:hypothetical protein
MRRRLPFAVRMSVGFALLFGLIVGLLLLLGLLAEIGICWSCGA